MKTLVAVLAALVMFHVAGFCAFNERISAGGIVVQGASNVSASPVVKGDFWWNLGNYFALGAQVGQALHFNLKDGPARKNSLNNPSGSNPYAGGRYHGHDEEENNTIIVINDNDTTNNITNVYPPATVVVAQPTPMSERVDLTENDYFFGEPFLRVGCSVCGFVQPYAEAFYGTTGMKVQSGQRNFGVSYGFGGGVNIVFQEFTLGFEALKRKIEVGSTGYDHLQFMAGAGWNF